MAKGPVGAVWLLAFKELRRHARAWLGLAILFGLLGGAATFAVAGADRTGSAFDRLKEKTLAADLYVASKCSDTACIETSDKLSRLPSVAVAAPMVNYLAALSTATGRPLSVGEDACYTGAGEIDLLMPADDRLGSTVNRYDLSAGSLPDPKSTDQVLVASEIARRFGIHVGDRLSLHGEACDQPEGVVPHTRTLRVVGIERSTIEQQPEIGFYILGVHGTQALYRALLDDGIKLDAAVAIRIRHPATQAQVIQEAAGLGIAIEPFLTLDTHTREIARGTRPDAVGALILGMFAAVAALVVIGPALIQQAAAGGPELRTLKTLGLTKPDLTRLGLTSGLFVGLLAAVIAGGLAVGLSSLSPFGEARRFDPAVGTYLSPHVGVGMGATAFAVVALVALGTVLGARGASLAWFKSVTSPARMVRSLRLRPAMATGVRMALELRRNAASVLGLIGVAAGVIGLLAALIFSSSLRHFDKTPSLVGWNWDVGAFLSGGENDERPTPKQMVEFRSDLLATPGVARASLVSFFPPQFSILSVDAYPMAFSTGVDSVRPTVIEGRAPAGPTEVLLNPRLAQRLNASVGDRLELRRADPRNPSLAGPTTVPFEVVGLGIVPLGDGRIDIGFALTLEGLASLTPQAGPDLVVLTLDRNADLRRVKAGLAATGHIEEGSLIDQLPTSSKLVQLDTEQVAAPPRIAAGLFAATAAAVLIHSVISSGRKRRRELAIFRSIGLSARQATSASVWQAVTATLVAVAVALPIGLSLGGRLWSVYAGSLGVKVQSSTSGRDVLLVVAIALVGAAVVAYWPARHAARRATAATLRAE